jgi:Tol biopolymer transport system component
MRKLLSTLTVVSGLVLSLVPVAASAQYSGVNDKVYFAGSDKTDIMRSNSDGTGLQTVLSTTDPISVPVVSKDGTKIVYARLLGSTSPGLWVVNVDGTNNHYITSTIGDHNPVWSPDASKVYFDNGGSIMSVNGNGGLRTTLLAADNDYNYYEPSISPSGVTLAVIGINTDTDRGDVFTLPATGGSATNISNNSSTMSSLWVDYSPTGTTFAVVNYLDPDVGLSSTRVDKLPVAGGSYTNILSNSVDTIAGTDRFFSAVNWSPDGAKLIAHRNTIQTADPNHLRGLLNTETQNFDGLLTVNQDGSSITELSTLGEMGPAWWSIRQAAAVVVTPGLPNVGAVK